MNYQSASSYGENHEHNAYNAIAGNFYPNLPPTSLQKYLNNSINPVVRPYSCSAPHLGSYKTAASPTTQNLIIPKKSLSENSVINELPFPHLSVSCVKKDLMKSAKTLKEFERLVNLVQVFKKTLSDEEWKTRCEEIKHKETEITNLLSKYDNEEYLLSAVRAVKKSAKKRIYRKRKKKEWQEMKRIRQTIREREHRRIDKWLENMKNEVERSRRNEQLKREADLVLAEVTSKKADAKRFMNLFNTLNKLRNARLQQLKSSGDTVSETEVKNFTQVIEKLRKLWIDQLKNFATEEQKLRNMLNDAEVERVNVEINFKRSIIKNWNEILFGQRTEEVSEVPHNLHDLIAIRHEWDRFLSSDNSGLNTKIPVGWIVPTEPSSDEWSNFLPS